MANLLYYLGPWLWEEAPDGDGGVVRQWRAPAGVAGSVDLRPLAAQAQAGGAPGRNVGFFAAKEPLPSEYELLAEGDLREAFIDARMRNVWETLCGYRADGVRLVDLLWDQLTAGAVVDGSAPALPLVPTVAGELELWLGGHSLVKRERFRWGAHPHTAKLRALLQREFRALWEASNGGPIARKWLDDQRAKLKLPASGWRDLVPADLAPHVPGPLPRETTVSDNFDRADQSGLGTSSEGWSWTVVSGTWSIAGNQAQKDSNVDGSARAESALSSTDHYAQVTLTQNSSGAIRYAAACGRFEAAAETYYMARLHTDGVYRFSKCVAATITNLGTSNTETIAVPNVIKFEANGSTLKRYFDGVERESITDTSLSGQLRAGMGARTSTTGAKIKLDNWSAADLAAPTGHPAIRRLGAARPAVGMSSTTLKVF